MDLLLAQAAQAAQSDPTALGVAIAAFAAAMASGAKQIADAIKNKGTADSDNDNRAAITKRLDKIEDNGDKLALAVARIEIHLEHIQKPKDPAE